MTHLWWLLPLSLLCLGRPDTAGDSGEDSAASDGSSLLERLLLLRISPGDFRSMSGFFLQLWLYLDLESEDRDLVRSLVTFSEFVSVVDKEDLLELLDTHPLASLREESDTESSSRAFFIEFLSTISLTLSIPSNSLL